MMDSKQIEIEWMKELLKENELEIWRLRKEIKNLKEERDNFMLKYAKAVEEKVVETNKLCTERNKIGEENETLKAIIDNNDLEQKADWKYIEELEEKYEKLKADYIKLSKIVEVSWWYKASYVNELRDEIAKLEKKLKTVTEGEIIIPIYDEEGKLVMKS